MKRHYFRNIGRVTAAVLLIGHLVVGCAGISSERALIKGAREFAKIHGVEADKYSATVDDRGDEYFVFFTRRSWPHSVGDHFGVRVNKETREHRLSYGR